MTAEGKFSARDQIRVDSRLRAIEMTGNERLDIPAHAWGDYPPEPISIKARDLGWACCMHMFSNTVPNPALKQTIEQWIVRPEPGQG